jgi:hypothetical protein
VAAGVGVVVGFSLDFGFDFDLEFAAAWCRCFSGWGVIRGRRTGVEVGRGVQVGREVGEGVAVLSGVKPTVGVGASARAGETVVSDTPTSRTPSRTLMQKRCIM